MTNYATSALWASLRWSRESLRSGIVPALQSGIVPGIRAGIVPPLAYGPGDRPPLTAWGSVPVPCL